METDKWQEWVKDERREAVMLAAFLGDEAARALFPEIPMCGKTLPAFMEGFMDLPWDKHARGGVAHRAGVRVAVALGRAVLPIAAEMNESEARAEVLYTTEAWLVFPHSVTLDAIQRELVYSAPPNFPRELRFMDKVGEVAFSMNALSGVVKSAEKILGRKVALEHILRELGAWLAEEDPVRRSIGERIFLGLTPNQGFEEAMWIDDAYPQGWEDAKLGAGEPIPEDRAFEVKGEELCDIVPNSRGLIIVSDAARAFLEEKGLGLEFVDCRLGEVPVFWVRPKERFGVLAEGAIHGDEFRFLQLDAAKCAKAPAFFFVEESPRFACFDLDFLWEWQEAGLKGMHGAVVPFGAPLNRDVLQGAAQEA